MIAFSLEPIDSTAHGSGTAFDQGYATPNEPAPWLEQVLSQLRNLSKLSENWDSYGAAPPNEDSLWLAQMFIEGLCRYVGARKPDIALAANGNVALMWEWQNGTRNLDIEIQPDGVINYSYLDEFVETRDEQGQTREGAKILSFLTNS